MSSGALLAAAFSGDGRRRRASSTATGEVPSQMYSAVANEKPRTELERQLFYKQVRRRRGGGARLLVRGQVARQHAEAPRWHGGRQPAGTGSPQAAARRHDAREHDSCRSR